MTRDVVFTALAERQIDHIFIYIDGHSGTARADAFTSGLVAYCRGLAAFPQRGTRRDDRRPDLRILGYRRRVAIAFTVEPQAVVILGLYDGGQDVEAKLRQE